MHPSPPLKCPHRLRGPSIHRFSVSRTRLFSFLLVGRAPEATLSFRLGHTGYRVCVLLQHPVPNLLKVHCERAACHGATIDPFAPPQGPLSARATWQLISNQVFKFRVRMLLVLSKWAKDTKWEQPAEQHHSNQTRKMPMAGGNSGPVTESLGEAAARMATNAKCQLHKCLSCQAHRCKVHFRRCTMLMMGMGPAIGRVAGYGEREIARAVARKKAWPCLTPLHLGVGVVHHHIARPGEGRAMPSISMPRASARLAPQLPAPPLKQH